jgi:hypothetical protein
MDRCQHLIRLLGWAWDDCGPDAERGAGCRLVCRHDDEEFTARGETMEAAWNEALWLVGRVQREVALPADA